MNFRMLENVSEWLKMVVSCSICRYYSAYRSAYSASFPPILPCSSPFSSAPTCSPLPLPIPPCLHPFHLVPPRSPSPYPFCLISTLSASFLPISHSLPSYSLLLLLTDNISCACQQI